MVDQFAIGKLFRNYTFVFLAWCHLHCDVFVVHILLGNTVSYIHKLLQVDKDKLQVW